MANNHYSQNRKFTITLDLEVEVKSISNYHTLTQVQIDDILKDVQDNMKEQLLGKIVNEYYSEGVSLMCDGVSYEIT